MDIIVVINRLSNKLDLNQDEKHSLLNAHVNDIYNDKAQGAFIRSKAKWIDKGEKKTSYFFHLENSRQTRHSITSIYVSDNISDDLEVINKKNTLSTVHHINHIFQKATWILFLIQLITLFSL